MRVERLLRQIGFLGIAFPFLASDLAKLIAVFLRPVDHLDVVGLVVALDTGDLDAFSRQDREYHASHYQAAGVPNLWTIVTARSGHIDRLRKLNLPEPGKSASILSCHERILDAVGAGDTAAAEAVVREHLSGTLAQVDKIMQRNPEYF